MAITQASIGTATWASVGTKSISISGINANDVLVLNVCAGDPATTVTNVTDNLGGTWTAGPSSPVSSGNLRGASFWKIAAGGETSISFDIGTGTTGQATAAKATGFTGTPTLEDSDEDESKLSSVGTTITLPAVNNTSNDAAVFACFASDRADTVQDVSRTYSNSFTELNFNSSSGSRAGSFMAGRVVSSTSSYGVQFTTGDTGDEMYGAILIFGDVTGGGGITGTLAVTEADDTISASGAVTVTGSISVTESADTLSSSGVVTVSGSISVTEAADTLSASGVVSSGIDGTVSVTEANDTSAASGTVTSTGTINVTEANDTCAASGTVGVGGTISVTEANDTCVASGTVATIITGTVNVNESNDTCSATGTVSGDVVISSALDGDVVSFARFAAEVLSQARVQAQLNSYPRLSHAGIYSEAA